MVRHGAPHSAKDSAVPTILAAVDGSASGYHAVAWAGAEAALRGCALHILTSMSVAGGFDLDIVPSLPEQHGRREGDQIAGEAARIARTTSGGATAITTEVTFELIASALITRSRQMQLLVVGSRGMGAFQRGMLGSVSTAVTHHAHCPVAVIHTTSALDAVSVGKPVVVGVDGTANSDAAIALAFDEAARRKVDLLAVHTWSDISGLDLPATDWDQPARAVLAESLAGHQEQYPDVEVRRVVTLDRPVRALLDQSEYGQLLVVGSRGRGGFSSMMLGSTSTALLHAVDIPMIIDRAPRPD
ncbi:universal stress protein [Nocardia sp. X0981]